MWGRNRSAAFPPRETGGWLGNKVSRLQTNAVMWDASVAGGSLICDAIIHSYSSSFGNYMDLAWRDWKFALMKIKYNQLPFFSFPLIYKTIWEGDRNTYGNFYFSNSLARCQEYLAGTGVGQSWKQRMQWISSFWVLGTQPPESSSLSARCALARC